MAKLISQEHRRQPSLHREEIYWQLRREILSCALHPGVELYEGVLAERFDVSKSPIRDALSRLHAEQLVTVIPRKGYRVSPISVADAADLFQFRSTLEANCAEISAARTDRAAPAELAELDRFREFDPDTTVVPFVTYNSEFHLGLVQLCPNGRMAETARTVIEQSERIVLVSMTANRTQPLEPLVDEHNAIIDALQARDGRLAKRLLTQHIGRAQKRLMVSLGNSAIVA
jgi:DNA-binding GntR family transcriptional regulator